MAKKTSKTAKKPAKKTTTKKATKKAAANKKATKKAPKKTAAKKKPAKAKSSPKRKPANNKTQKTAGSVESYLDSLEASRGDDCRQLAGLMREATGDEGAMWGPSIVGFGHTHLVYETGREMDWFLVGFSSRKQALTLYLMGDFESRAKLLARLGPHKTGKSCLYVKSLGDVDLATLKSLITDSVRAMRAASKA